MILSFKSSNETVSELPYELLWKVWKDFANLIENNIWAIRELNAGGEHAKKVIEQMKKLVSWTLPDADPKRIVWGVLNFTNEPYLDYTQKESKKWNKSLWSQIVEKCEERYFDSLSEYLKNETFTTSFGSYHLELTSVNYQIESSTPYQFVYNHQNWMHWKVKTHSTWDQFILEEDVVGINDFSNDLKSPYMQFDTRQVTWDFTSEYAQIMTWEYIPNNHRPCIQGIDNLLGV